MDSVERKMIGCVTAAVVVTVRLAVLHYPWWKILIIGMYSLLGFMIYLWLWQSLFSEDDET